MRRFGWVRPAVGERARPVQMPRSRRLPKPFPLTGRWMRGARPRQIRKNREQIDFACRPEAHGLHPVAPRLEHMSRTPTFDGVGRLYRGHRNLGCVGYSLQSLPGQSTVVRFDPMPDAAKGDVFHLTLEDGRILECQVMSDHAARYCAVIYGPRVERRVHRRPAPITRAFL